MGYYSEKMIEVMNEDRERDAEQAHQAQEDADQQLALDVDAKTLYNGLKAKYGVLTHYVVEQLHLLSLKKDQACINQNK